MKEKILIVDDNPMNIDVFNEALGHAWEILVASTFDEAFKTLDTKDVKLILLDVVLKEGRAFDFIAKRSEIAPEDKRPIIFLASMEDRHEMHRAMRLGGVDYIFKPLDIQEIQMTLRNQMKLIGE